MSSTRAIKFNYDQTAFVVEIACEKIHPNVVNNELHRYRFLCTLLFKMEIVLLNRSLINGMFPSTICLLFM